MDSQCSSGFFTATRHAVHILRQLPSRDEPTPSLLRHAKSEQVALVHPIGQLNEWIKRKIHEVRHPRRHWLSHDGPTRGLTDGLVR